MPVIYPVIVEKTLVVIEKDFRNTELNLDTISESVCIDKYYLCRVFKRTMGITIQGYLLDKRIDYFKTLISNKPQEPLSLLMHKSGFISYRSLSHYLKSHHHLTVTDFITKVISIK